MRTIPANTLSVLQNAGTNGIEVRDFVWFETVGTPYRYGFYSDIEPAVSVAVIDGQTGATATREYLGAGALHSVSDITLTVGLNIYSVSIVLSNVHPTVQEMVRGRDIRNARVEIHRGIINPATGLLADPPIVNFIGTVNKATPRRPPAGGEGGVTITAVSALNELTRTNPAKFSDATISRRGGDRLLRYVDIMGDVRLHWGAEQQ